MRKDIFKGFKLKINYFKEMTYFFNTIYFMKQCNKFSSAEINSLNKINPKIICLDYKELITKNKEHNSILENDIFNKDQNLFLLDFQKVSDEDLLLFLSAYHANENNQKNPIIILNKSAKVVKRAKKLSLGYYLILKYGTNKKIVIRNKITSNSKKNKWYVFGFSALNLLSFIFMSLFGSTTQYVRMSALLESMTYFMNSQPENSRIHAVYHEYFESVEERTAVSVKDKYSNWQNRTTSYEFREIFNSYFIAGTPEDLIEFNVKFKDYDDDSLQFKTKIISQSVYSNQKRVLMEKIDLEQYLIKEYAHHSPLGGADTVYYMPSNIADELINGANRNDFKTYSDFIGKVIVVTYKKDDIQFEQTMSINNIFYTSNIPTNVGEPTNNNEKVNIYSKSDKNLGAHLLSTLGNFGVAITTLAHKTFGSVFCLDFFGYNKILKMMLDRYFINELKIDTSYFQFFYLNEPISKFDIKLNAINDFYRGDYGFFYGANIPYLVCSLLTIVGGFSLLCYYLERKKNVIFKSNSRQYIPLFSLLLVTPFIVSQSFYLLIITICKHDIFSIGLMNLIGSPFSLIITLFLLLYLFISFEKSKKNVYKLEI